MLAHEHIWIRLIGYKSDQWPYCINVIPLVLDKKALKPKIWPLFLQNFVFEKDEKVVFNLSVASLLPVLTFGTNFFECRQFSFVHLVFIPITPTL